MIPEADLDRAVVVVYDLREAWGEAHEDRQRWGEQHTDVFALGLDHVVLVFRPGGAAREAA